MSRPAGVALTALLAAGSPLLLERLARAGRLGPVPEPAPFAQSYLDYLAELRRPLFDGGPSMRGFFPPRDAPAMPKPKDVLRVICVGESTVLLPGFVEELAARLPTLNRRARWEFINAGAGAVDVRNMERFAREALAYSPDILVLYFGNNVRFRHPAARLAVFRAWNAAQRSALARLVLARLASAPPARDHDRALAEAVLRLARESRERGARLVVGVPSRNLLYPPSRRNAPAALGGGCASYEDGKPRAALAALRREAALQPDAAPARYRHGRAALAAGDCPAARAELEAALRLDPNDWRMPARTGAVLRSVARLEGLPLFDFDAALRRESRCGAPGYDFFIDAMHPSSEGYRLLAGAALAAVAGDKALWPRLGAAASPSPGVAAPKRATDRVSWLVHEALVKASCAEREPEIAVVQLEEALRRDAPRARALMNESLAAGAYGNSISRNARVCDPERDAGLARIYAAVAARRLGGRAQAAAWLAEASVSPRAAVQAAVEVQRSLDEKLAGRPEAARTRRERALALDPAAGSDPWLGCR